MRLLAFVFAVTVATAGPATAKKAGPTKGDKLRPYVGFIEAYAPAVLVGRRKYMDSLDAKKGPRCDKPPTLPAPVKPSPDALVDLESAAKAKDADPSLAEAATLMRESLEELDVLLAEAGEYWRGPYRKDKCQRGQALHMRVTSSWDKFLEGERVVRQAADKMAYEQEEAELAKVKKKYGDRLRFHHALGLTLATRLYQTITAQALYDVPAAAVVKNAFAEYKNEVTALVDLAKTAEADARKSGFSSFSKAALDFLAAADQAGSPMLKGRRPGEKEAKALADRHDALVRAHGTVTFDKKMK